MKTEPTINIQDEVVKTHAQYGITEIDNYHIGKLSEKHVKQFSLKVKQLEWVEYENLRGRKSYFAETPFTPYEVLDGGGYYVMFSPSKRLKFKSADEAKSAAQKDFETRVNECLIIE